MQNFICFLSIVFVFLPNTQSARGGGRYDKSLSVFSPEGELLQVQYAERAALRGMPLVCMLWNNSILLCTPSQPLDSLLDRRVTHKVSRIDEGVWVAFAGLTGDGRAMVRLGRQFAIDFRGRYGSSAPVSAVATFLGDAQHATTLKGGERPYGVHALVFGFDSDHKKQEPSLYLVRASGQVSRWRGMAIGSGADRLTDELEHLLVPPIGSEPPLPLTLADQVARLINLLKKASSPPSDEPREERLFDIFVYSADGAAESSPDASSLPTEQCVYDAKDADDLPASWRAR